MGEKQAPVQDGQSCGVDYTPSAPESPIPEAVRNALLSFRKVFALGRLGWAYPCSLFHEGCCKDFPKTQ